MLPTLLALLDGKSCHIETVKYKIIDQEQGQDNNPSEENAITLQLLSIGSQGEISCGFNKIMLLLYKTKFPARNCLIILRMWVGKHFLSTYLDQ